MKPSYEPADGRLPFSVTETLFVLPVVPAAVKVKVAGETVTVALEVTLEVVLGCTLKVKVAVAALTFTTFTVMLLDTVVAVSAPNSMVAGSRVKATLRASPALSFPAPTASTRATDP